MRWGERAITSKSAHAGSVMPTRFTWRIHLPWPPNNADHLDYAGIIMAIQLECCSLFDDMDYRVPKANGMGDYDDLTTVQ
jgi:hypothetical protein